MLFGNHGQALLVMQERHSRLLAAVRVPGKAAEPVAQAMAGCWPLSRPIGAVRWPLTTAPSSPGITNCMNCGVQTFFCNVRSPWQKGGVENRIGRLRRFLPRRTDLSALNGPTAGPIGRGRQQHPTQVLGVPHSS